MLTLYDRMQIVGTMPERAILRLKRAGIPLYDIQKPQKDKLTFRVQRKDARKVLAIYPDNGEERAKSAYIASKIGAVGLSKAVDFCKNRVGFVLGGLAFCILTLAADSFVFGVEFVGTDVYARETMQALDESGIKLFTPYQSGKEDIVTAKILALDFVEFCSVKKVGGRLRVETRISPFTQSTLQKGEMQAKHTGTLLSITVLRGSPMKKAGDTVYAGETLVGDWISIEEKGQVRVEPIARVQIACVYEGAHTGAITQEEAFAQAYLALDLGVKDEVTDVAVTEIDGVFHVRIDYVVTESINL